MFVHDGYSLAPFEILLGISSYAPQVGVWSVQWTFYLVSFIMVPFPDFDYFASEHGIVSLIVFVLVIRVTV